MTTKLLEQSFLLTITASTLVFTGCITPTKEPTEEPKPDRVVRYEDQAVSKDSTLLKIEAEQAKIKAQQLENERIAREKRIAVARREREMQTLLKSAMENRSKNLSLSAEEIAAEKIDRLTKGVNGFIAKSEYEKAREAIWRFPKENLSEKALKIINEAREDLIKDVVNVKHWLELEKQITDKVDPLMAEKKYAEVRAYLETVKPIRTYTILFDKQVDAVAKVLIEMGLSKESLDPVCASTRKMIAAAFEQMGEKYDDSKYLEFKKSFTGAEAYNASVKELWDTLVKYDCSHEKANEIVSNLRKMVGELIEQNYLKDTASESLVQTLVSLGTTQFNVKLEELRKGILEKVSAGEAEAAFTAARESYDQAVKELEQALKENQFADIYQLVDRIEELKTGLQEAAKKAGKKLEDKFVSREELLARVDKCHAEFLTQELVRKVRACVSAKDWEGARAVVRDEPRIGRDGLDMAIYAIRAGLLNTLVNPVQCKEIISGMDEKFAEFLKNKDFNGCADWLKGSFVVVDDYDKILSSLKNAAQIMESLGMETDVSQKKMEDVRKQLQDILDKRAGCFKETDKRDYSELSAELGSLESAIIDQTLNIPLAAGCTNNLMQFAVAWFGRDPESMTTCEMNQKILAKIAEYRSDLNDSVEKARIEAALAERRKLIEDMDREVGFDTQISVAEEAIKRGLYLSEKGFAQPALSQGFHPVLGEYARIFRLMKPEVELTAAQKQTLLVAGAWLNQPAVVEWALKLGAKVNEPAARDILARPAILAAIRAGNLELVRTLMKAGAAMNVADAKKNTVLHYAARIGSLDLINIAVKDNDVNAKNAEGRTALFAPAELNRLPQVKALLAAKADATVADNGGYTAFDAACAAKSMLVLDALIEGGAPVSAGAFVRAARSDELALVQWFVAHGVDVNAEGVMAAAAEARNAGNLSTYNYLVGQGGMPVAAPVKPVVVVPPASAPEPVPVEVIKKYRMNP